MRCGIFYKVIVGLLVLSVFAKRNAARARSPIYLRHTIGLADTPAVIVGKFLIKDEQGRIIDIAALKGKVLFINFWALTCVPCKVEMPTINKLYERYRDDTDVMFFEIDLNNDLVNSPKYMRDKGFGLGVYYVASAVPQTLFRGELPSTAIVDKNGRIVYFHEGADDYGDKKFMDLVDRLVQSGH
jgi:thiol-disulfide isomerase/thioredoxin